MDFDFQDFHFQDHNGRPSNENIEQILNQDDEHNNTWDKFDVPQSSHEDLQNSQISDFFNEAKPRSKQSSKSQKSQQVNESRNVIDISYGGNNSIQNNSFRFENNVLDDRKVESTRYQRLSVLLSQAKSNNLDAFYRNLQRQSSQPSEPPIYSKEEFRKHVKQLKINKKQEENMFGLKNRDTKVQYNYGQNKKNQPEQFSAKNFKKKTSNHFYSQQPQQDNFFDFEPNANNQSRNSCDKKSQKNPYANIKQSQEYQFQEFPMPPAKHNKYPPQKDYQNSQNLRTIQEQKPIIFEKTLQQQKLNFLLNNYKDMKTNFDVLMKELKDNHNGQEAIIEELKRVKEHKKNIDKQAQKERKKIEKNQAAENKKKQFEILKDSIGKIQQNNKDLLFMKINQKIQTLQSAVKSALDQMNEEKEKPFIPKIINYFCQPNDQASQHQISRASSKPSFSHDSAGSPAKDSRHEIATNMSRMPQSDGKDEKNIISPFDIALQTGQQNNYIDADEFFKPSASAKQYFPRSLDLTNKNMRKCLTQKNSLVYQSFQFHVSAKFTLQENEAYPLTVEMRVGNKCMINLSDVFVIVYGPQGIDLHTKPTKICYDILKQDTSFNFQVYLPKQCLEENGFYLQIGYRTDLLSKKKINIKIPLPLIQLIRPEFIYQQQFLQNWNMLANQLYISPRPLDFMHIRSHQDIKLILPFTHITNNDSNIFSYGLMFRYPKSQLIFLLKLDCFINGKASIHLRTDKMLDQKIKEELLDVISFLLLSPS